ncbi:hypothetical protein MMC07_002322 [Pseudocyphellaria aurata]|nr:hypothetical protein [Pseudocyphellaria aurata]
MAAQNADKQWDPIRTLELHSLGQNFSCAGVAVTQGNARCRKPIELGQQLKACRILDTLAVTDPSSPAVTQMLMELVPLLLCRGSQGHGEKPEQKSTLISDWSAKIRRLLRQQWGGMPKKKLEKALNSIYEKYYAAHLDLSGAQMRLEEEHKETQQKLGRVKHDFDEARRRADESDTRSVNVASEVTNLQSDLREARRQLEENQTALDSTTSRLQESQHQLQERNTELQNHQSSIAALEHDLKSAKDRLEETQRQLQERNTAYQKHQSWVSSLQRDLKNTNDKLQETQHQLQGKNTVLQNPQSSAAANQKSNRPLEAIRQGRKKLVKSFSSPPGGPSAKI